MKLRTKLTASHDGSLVDATDENLITDAACAHALMLAMALELPMPHLMAVKEKADEIMAGWGYGEAE